jgi:uncharacterized protein (DUF924 family)
VDNPASLLNNERGEGMATSEEVLRFWLDEVKPSQWYNSDAALDAEIHNRFGALYEYAMEGGCALWLTYPSGVLAYSILLDQFPRNMFRDDARAFASDPIARAAVKAAIHKEWDLRIDAPARQFFYLPIMHSESLSDQEKCVRLFVTRMSDAESNILHARVHREIIRLFGRFPGRNAALGRKNSHEEQAFLDEQGYSKLMEQLAAQASGVCAELSD